MESFHVLFSQEYSYQRPAYLNQILRELALLIFGAADGRDDPVSLLSSETLVKAGKCDQFWRGFGEGVLRGKKINKMR